MRRETLLDIATAAMALAAVAVTVTAYISRRPAPVDSSPTAVADWHLYGLHGHCVGSDEPAVTIVVFNDYECAACQHFESILKRVVTEESPDVALVYRHFPLPQHRLAHRASRAAECAADQGQFLSYHRALFQSSDFLGGDWTGLARLSGVADLQRFADCVASLDPVPSIDRDIADATLLRAPGTPTILVNGLMLRSVPDSAALDEFIESARRASTTPHPTPRRN
jgi:protein-disulfide isomerase